MKRAKFFFVLIFFATILQIFSSSIHTVKKGDTLFSISRTYGVSIDELCRENEISRDSQINIGQALKIPGVPSTKSDSENLKNSQDLKVEKKSNEEENATQIQTEIYTVKKGDTWYGISRANGISVPQLWTINNVDSTAELKAGQKIKIPKINENLAKSEKKDEEKKDESKVAKIQPEKNEKSEAKNQSVQISDPRTFSKSGDANLLWPVKANSVFYINGKVGGVLISSPKNADVTAISSGNVMFSGSYRGFGNVVFIQSKTRHIYAYTGLGAISVSKGDYVVFGAKIGSAGVDAHSGKNGVSLMVFQNGMPIDPAKAPRG